MRGPIENEFEKAIAKALLRNEVEPGARILVGLSGGPDSVALLHGMLALSGRGAIQQVMAAHLNHRLRGAESDRDENFARRLCTRLGIELVVERAEGLSGLRGNLEERARLFRHDFLNRVAERLAADYIALAHHADDQAETVLMRMMRGCGLAGASAMSARGPGRLLRPLLGVRRAEIVGYLEALGSSWVADSSNLQGLNARSRIRNELLPLLERDYAPQLAARLNEFADESRSTADFLTMCARAELRRRCAADGSLGVAGFDSLHPALAAAMLREYLRERRGDLLRVNRAHIEGMRSLCLEGPPNGTCTLPDGWRMRREYPRAVIEPIPFGQPVPFEIRLASGNRVTIDEAGFTFDLKNIEAGTFFSAKSNHTRTGPMETLFDADRVGDYVTLRNFRHGDRIRPMGMTGSRKI
ncbi:MAG TPA: tRNA lysidine(34) synthetase TilS, partial [Candidatus Binataceae bacterium]|nr:tRNA lysidine(34) synthetase TilS [Candidatus Binataceae bacterium]